MSNTRAHTVYSMARKPIITYLKTYRRRTGFSQGEIAFLLGGFKGSTVSRHETAARVPTLPNALMYELVFRIPVQRLYVGVFRTVRSTVVSRAGFLRRSLLRQPRTLLRDKKIAVLDRLIEEYGDEGVATEK